MDVNIVVTAYANPVLSYRQAKKIYERKNDLFNKSFPVFINTVQCTSVNPTEIEAEIKPRQEAQKFE